MSVGREVRQGQAENIVWCAGHDGNAIMPGTPRIPCDFRGIPPAAIVCTVPEFHLGNVGLH